VANPSELRNLAAIILKRKRDSTVDGVFLSVGTSDQCVKGNLAGYPVCELRRYTDTKAAVILRAVFHSGVYLESRLARELRFYRLAVAEYLVLEFAFDIGWRVIPETLMS
jgi:hypothetical protein